MKNESASDMIDKVRLQWDAELPELDTSPLGTIGRILRIERLAGAHIRAALASYGIDRSGLDVLATLRRTGPPYEATPTHLYKALVLTSGAMTNRIDVLERAGFIQRNAAENDRRSRMIRLTDKGRQLVDAAFATHLEIEGAMVAHLSPAERRSLETMLRKILLRLEDQDA